MSDQLPARLEDSACQKRAQDAGHMKVWVRAWLTCDAFYYAFFWVSQFLLNALPPLIRVAVSGYRPSYFRVSAFNVVAMGALAGLPGGFQSGAQRPDLFSLAMLVPLALVAVALLAAGRKVRLLSGLGIAMIGQAALGPYLARLFFLRQSTAAAGLAFILFFAIICFGLRWMLGNQPGYPGRVASLLAGFVFLQPWPWIRLARAFRIPSYALLFMAPGAVASLLVSLRPRNRPEVTKRSFAPSTTSPGSRGCTCGKWARTHSGALWTRPTRPGASRRWMWSRAGIVRAADSGTDWLPVADPNCQCQRSHADVARDRCQR